MRKKLVAALAAIPILGAAVVAVFATGAQAAGVCTDPQFTFEGQGGQGMGKYFASAAIWNPDGQIQQTMGVCSHDSWYVDVTEPNHQDRAVISYPNVHYDFVTDWSTNPLSGMRRLDSFGSLESGFAAQTPSGGIWNVAFDIWLNGVGNGDGTTELMIWTENSGQRPAGTYRGDVTVQGRAWELWTTRETPDPDSFIILTYKAKQTWAEGDLDVLAFTDHLMATGRLAEDSVVGQIGYGVEIVQTDNQPKHFDFTNFDVRFTDSTTSPEPDPTTPEPDPTTPSPDPSPSETETEQPADPGWLAGKVTVDVIPDEYSVAHVDLPDGAFDEPPTLQVTAYTSVPGHRVKEVSVKNVTADGFDVVIYRTTNVNTTVFWLAVQE